ncbi:carbohydrate esterase family 15 protein [Tulasnella calospora MUT 4182]|uniref:(4-O-methyl)-D-glucuronate--lignin esterase n=1 Tax=Tulasnella calospora MUT 4182 TaxID=1051891 RepID=A0A0C3MGZ2_9AGAM|nr:carbohydrate esterase family 15 protein [Tulasnella calospora MUT 4182]
MKLSTSAQVIFALVSARIVAAQSPVWGQCGGQGWNGGLKEFLELATTCVAGSTCVYSNPWYSQCLPGNNGGTTTTTTTTTTTPPTTTPGGGTSTTTTTTTTTTPGGGPSSCPTPGTLSGYNNAKLPNPFLFDDGTPVQSAADWECRRKQISALIQGYEAGTLPPKPSSVTATFSKSGNTGSLRVTVSNGGSSVSWTNSITYPSGTAPAGGWPLVIAYEGGSIPVPSGIASLNFPCSTIAEQTNTGSRGKGLFYTIYGSNHSASAMTAWVWGVSRVIDALESTSAAEINTSKLAVTGCSRNGKGALMAGAFETRIALTIPQESGSGGDACWRLSKYEESQGSKVQTATQIITENVWFSSNFGNYVNNLNQLPYDHHLLIAMVAPRGIISYENTDYVWLSPLSNWGCVSGARPVFQALGIQDNLGFQQVGGHGHCSWPSSLTPTLNAFFNKFLLGQNVNTAYFSTNNQFGGRTWTASNWIDWTTPNLN